MASDVMLESCGRLFLTLDGIQFSFVSVVEPNNDRDDVVVDESVNVFNWVSKSMIFFCSLIMVFHFFTSRSLSFAIS